MSCLAARTDAQLFTHICGPVGGRSGAVAVVIFKVTYTGAAGMKTRELNRIMTEAWGKAGVLYHRRMLPKRFTEEGARELHYTGRSSQYQRRKKAVKGHNLPFVWTGSTRDASRLQDVRPYSTGGEGGVKIVTHARVLNFQPGLLEEFTSVSAAERRQIEKMLSQEVEYGIARSRNRRVVNIRG